MIIFVGDKPSPKMKPGAKPFEGAACEARLMEWIKKLGVNPYYLINSTETECLNMALLFVSCKAPVVALGNNASKALHKIPHFKLPHPSGKNRQINDKAFIEKKLEECKNYLKSQGK